MPAVNLTAVWGVATSSTPLFFFFFFNDTATTEIYTLSLHDALPIWKDYLAAVETFHIFRFQPEFRRDQLASRECRPGHPGAPVRSRFRKHVHHFVCQPPPQRASQQEIGVGKIAARHSRPDR